MKSCCHAEGGGTKSCGVVFTRWLVLLALLRERGGGEGSKRFPPFKRGGGNNTFYAV